MERKEGRKNREGKGREVGERRKRKMERKGRKNRE